MKLTIKKLLQIWLVIAVLGCTGSQNDRAIIMTVTGPINPEAMGLTLEHEHITTDFTGAEIIPQPQYPVGHAVTELLASIKSLQNYGVKTFVECTPEYIGRDVLLLKELSIQSGIQIITNTGYYTAVDKKYLPAHAFTESADELAARWIAEWKNGINNTGIRPGFIKLGVGNKSLDEIERKIVRAGAKAHLKTGLKIAIHTEGAAAAFDEVEILQEEGVAPQALIIVHSQTMESSDQVQLARRGTWISLDGIDGQDETIDKYTNFLLALKTQNLLSQVLISHDDGWAVIKQDDGSIVFERFGNRPEDPFSPIFEKLIPNLSMHGFSSEDIDMLLIDNPAKAFTVQVLKI